MSNNSVYVVIDAFDHQNVHVCFSLDGCERYVSEILETTAVAKEDEIHFDYSLYDKDTNKLLEEYFIERWFIDNE